MNRRHFLRSILGGTVAGAVMSLGLRLPLVASPLADDLGPTRAEILVAIQDYLREDYTFDAIVPLTPCTP